jgi:hypothetical protein
MLRLYSPTAAEPKITLLLFLHAAQLLDQWNAVVRGSAERWASKLRTRFAGASLVAVAAPTVAQIVQNTAAEAYSHRAASALGLLATLGGGAGTALLTELAVLSLPTIMAETHKQRRGRGTRDDIMTGRQPHESAMVVDDNTGTGMTHSGDDGLRDAEPDGAPIIHVVVEVLRAYPSVLDQLVLWMEEQCALSTTTDQEVVDHLQSLRMFRDARVLRGQTNATGGPNAAVGPTLTSALRTASVAKERGGRVAQAAAELSALLPAV